ncbi:hypothetical protein JOF29_004469 [Kribbella aluminosa]|uniref:Uncharacterized protein n=1 Tax=Kribbella aluminosa TaxID=416017 RepID=A0ABS4UNZ0_9ACTN|nr:hypothetical protein [Kribbella aluminosa]
MPATAFPHPAGTTRVVPRPGESVTPTRGPVQA